MSEEKITFDDICIGQIWKGVDWGEPSNVVVTGVCSNEGQEAIILVKVNYLIDNQTWDIINDIDVLQAVFENATLLVDTDIKKL